MDTVKQPFPLPEFQWKKCGFWQWSLCISGLVSNKSCKQELISKNLDTWNIRNSKDNCLTYKCLNFYHPLLH